MSNQQVMKRMDVTEDAILQARREYQRNYRKNNPDKVRQWQRNFYAKRAMTTQHLQNDMEVR